MKLVVGLGNPGRKYANTRHNIGFEVVAEFARRHQAPRPRGRFSGEATEVRLGEQQVLLLWPMTYMNRSGRSVHAARDFYKLDSADILVVCDDFQLPLARLRFRPKGSAGGQKGLADILQQLGTQEVPRLRFGIDSPPPEWDVADYVLSRFHKDEQETVRQAVQRAGDGVADWVLHGTSYCMNQYNADAPGQSE